MHHNCSKSNKLGDDHQATSSRIPQIISCQSGQSHQLHKIIERDKDMKQDDHKTPFYKAQYAPKLSNLPLILLILSCSLSILSLSQNYHLIECRQQAPQTNYVSQDHQLYLKHASEDDDRLNVLNIVSRPTTLANSWPEQASKKFPDFLFAEDTSAKLRPELDKLDKNITEWLSTSDSETRTLRKKRIRKGENLKGSKKAWQLLHEHTQAVLRNKIELIIKPEVELLLGWPETQNVSRECRRAIDRTLNGALNLDSWAVKLLSSWGSFPPVSPLDGVYNDIGSYSTCMSVEENDQVGHAHFCSLSFRPILPERSMFNTIFKKEEPELLHLFDRKPTSAKDFFADLMKNAHYFRFMYMKVATCWPIDCSPFDIKHMVRALGMRSMLIHGPIKCTSENPGDYEPPEPETNHTSSQTAAAAAAAAATTTTNNATTFGKSILYRSSKPLSDRYLDLDIYTYKPQFAPIQRVCIIILLSVFGPLLLITLGDIALNRMPAFYERYLERLSQTQIFAPLPTNPPDGVAVLEEMDGHERKAPRSQPECSFNGTGNNISSYPGPIKCDQKLSIEDEQDRATLATSASTLEIIKHTPNANVNNGNNSNNEKMSQFFMDSKGEQRVGVATRVSAKVARSSGARIPWLAEYSAVTNWQKFFHVSSKEKPYLINCIDGLRVFTIAWTIINHVMLGCDWSTLGRLRELEKPLQDFLFQPMLNAVLLVDTFFVISGVLSAYTIFNWTKDDFTKFNWLYFLGGRWFRLTPQMLLMTAIYIILPLFGSGPNWFPPLNEYSDNCVSNWWTQVFQVQSFVDRGRICNMVTWWVSCDFAYQIVATFLIYLIIATRNNWRYALIATGLLISSNISIQAFLHYTSGFPPQILASYPQDAAVWDTMGFNFQWKFYSHTVPFFAGFFVGYLMSMRPRLLTDLLTPRNVALCWSVFTVNALVLGYSCYWWIGELVGYTQPVATGYHVVTPIMWTYNHVWIIVACHYGHGGWLNSVLSCSFFKVLSRATYMTYLAHPQIILLFYGKQQLLQEPNGFVMFFNGYGIIIMSYLYGIFLTIFLEYPYLRLLSKGLAALMSRHKKK